MMLPERPNLRAGAQHLPMSPTAKASLLTIAVLTVVGTLSVQAQTFDLDRFDQLYRPRLRSEVWHLLPTNTTEPTGTFGETGARASLTFPIHRHLSAGVQLDLTAGSWKELVQRSVRIRASQVLGQLHAGTRQVQADALLGTTRQLHSFTAGALGISLGSKYRVLFWSATANVSEEDRTMAKPAIRFNGLIGKLHIKGLRRNHFYGLAAGFSDGLDLPVPFFGGTTPMGRRFTLQYVLPVQASLIWKADGRTRVHAGIGLRGDRSGLELPTGRVNMSVVGGQAFLGVRHRVGKHARLRGELAYLPEQRVLFGVNDLNGLDAATRMQHGVLFTAGIDLYFGDDLLHRIVEEVLC